MKEIINSIITDFIISMNYLENEHVLGLFFYGSYLTGFNDKYSDIDLHVVFDDSNPSTLIRGIKHVKNYKIEYFEKPISDLYLSVENDFQNQSNALLSIIGTSKIVLDKTGKLYELQQYVLDKFSNPLPKLSEDDAKEYVSILNNRMEKLEKLAKENNPYFYHLYHLTIEKIRKFYHKLNGMPEVQTSKVFRVYTDEAYRNSFYKDEIPEENFINMYLNLICDNSEDTLKLLSNIKSFYYYSIRTIHLDDKEYRIRIQSRNK